MKASIKEYLLKLTRTTLIGEIKPYAGSGEPTGWKLCNGQELTKASYPELYAVIGDAYGTASDNNHFKLPDLSGRTPIGTSNDYVLASSGGETTHKLTSAECALPNHSHAIGASSNMRFMVAPYDSTGFTRHTVSSGSGAANMLRSSQPISRYQNTDGASIANATNAHNNMQPYLTINFLIYVGGGST